MRGELDDALARLRRWNEVRERIEERSGRDAEPVPDDPALSPPSSQQAGSSPVPPSSAGSSPLSGPLPVRTPPDPAGPSSWRASAGAPAAPPVSSSGTSLPDTPPAGSPMLTGAGTAGQDRPAGRTGAHSAGAGAADAASTVGPATVPPGVVEEVLGAIGDIVRRNLRLAVTVTVDDAGTAWTAHLVRDDDGRLAITRLEPRTFSTISTVTPPVWPRPEQENRERENRERENRERENRERENRERENPERTASRLAELIRRDPSLLDPPPEPPR